MLLVGVLGFWGLNMRISQLHLLRTMHTADSALADGSALPALNALLKTAGAAGARSVLITHVLPTAVAYVNAVHQVFPVQTVIAIPYSADQTAIKQLQANGHHVVVPSSVADTFVQAHHAVLSALEVSDSPLVVQEVGGYLAEYTANYLAYPHFRGIVEDTNNGHWRYERYGPHSCPVISMAQSPLKDIEDTLIGDAVVYSVERILREEFSSVLEGARCVVIGYGKIGTSTSIALRGRETVVSIYDINPAKNMRARVEGFFPKPLHEALAEAELVIGCTGQTSIRAVDMSFIRDGAVLASASSKNVEFALRDFQSECQSFEEISPNISRYVRKNGTHFYVLYQGTPVNFRDRSILGTILDMIYCELFICMREVVAGHVTAGLHHSPPPIQNEVAKAWLAQHAPEFAAAHDDKVWDYPESLKLGLPN